MASVNKSIILGNVGRDPEVKYSANGNAVCNLSIATTRKWKDKQGETAEETEWHRVVLFDRLAEVAGEYLAKGLPVYIEGRLRTRKWTDKDGIEKYTTEIYAESLQLLGRKPGLGEGGHRDHGRPAAPSERSQNAQPQRQQRPQPRSNTGFDDMDDDIPF